MYVAFVIVTPFAKLQKQRQLTPHTPTVVLNVENQKN
jgi:hypothetical protein